MKTDRIEYQIALFGNMILSRVVDNVYISWFFIALSIYYLVLWIRLINKK